MASQPAKDQRRDAGRKYDDDHDRRYKGELKSELDVLRFEAG